MEEISLIKDLKSRPVRYLKELWQSSPVSFSGGNAFYAAATGVVGGFAISSLPVAAIQLGITGIIAFEQVKATHKGKGYDTPFRRLAYANWATAAALVCGAATAGTPIAFAAASIPAVVLAAWGAGHWDLKRMLNQIETGKGQDLAHSDHVQPDPMVAKLIRRSQLYFGFADCGAVISNAVKGDNIQQVAHSLVRGLGSAEAIVPLAIFCAGLAKASSKRASDVIDKTIPKFVAHLIKGRSSNLTPNRLYGLGYAAAGAGTFVASMLGSLPVNASLIAETTCLVSAYGIWARAYFALDEVKPEPESAANYRQRPAAKATAGRRNTISPS